MIVTLVTALLSMSNDYVGLKRFYEATNGASWCTSRCGWLTGEPCSECRESETGCISNWDGVSCIDGRVTSLRLFPHGHSALRGVPCPRNSACSRHCLHLN